MKGNAKINFLFPMATTVMAIVWVYKGLFEYGLWDEAARCPADGLFPVLIGSTLLVSSVINLVSSFKEDAIIFEKKALILLAALALIYILTPYLGFLPTIFVYYVLWLRLFAKVTWKNTIIATVVMFVIVYGTFSLWLKVPFPVGMIFEML